MHSSVFEFEDYKEFVHSRIDASPNRGRGLRRKIAAAVGCQVAYVSHVLGAERHFSLEQAEALSRFLSLRSDEAEYFLLLVEFNRAGTHSLREFLRKQVNRRREDYKQLKARVQIKGRVSPEDQAIYYSSWHYQAVRMLLTIPGFRTAPAIAGKLNIPIERASEILGYFLEKGLAKEVKDGYATTDAQIHLGHDSPLISKLHSNWRVHTLGSLDRRNDEDFHYSSAVTLSHSDFQKVREIIVKGLLVAQEVIKPSKEERLCVMAMDFYEI